MQDVIEKKKFIFGVNYWASKNAIKMWKNWNEDDIRADLTALKSVGVDFIRIFPTWNDFQPIKYIKGGYGQIIGVCYSDETPLPDTPEGRAGIDIEMIKHLDKFMDIAHSLDIMVEMAMITGFMSFKMLVPEMFADSNLLCDSDAIMWEVKLTKYLVNRYKDHPALAAWNLGNECNCFASIPYEQQWVWANTIGDAIRSLDHKHPIISGINDNVVGRGPGGWDITLYAETVDVLTAHPYAVFRTKNEPINTLRPHIRTLAEIKILEGIGNKPALVEEVGSIGYLYCGYTSEAEYIRCDLLANWVHGGMGYLWWCAFDQGDIDIDPYNRNNIGSEYGFLKDDLSKKPMTDEALKVLKTIKNSRLPEIFCETVCFIQKNLPNGPGYNANDYATYAMCLASMADMGINFKSVMQEIPDAKLYILPRVTGTSAIEYDFLQKLLEKVRNGATFFFSLDDGFMRKFPEITGIEIDSREAYTQSSTVLIDNQKLNVSPVYKYNIRSFDGEVLAAFEDQTPAIISRPYGKGKIICSLFSPERELETHPGSCYNESVSDYSLVYRVVAGEASLTQLATTDNRFVCATVHMVNDKKAVVSVINYDRKEQAYNLNLAEGWKITDTIYGEFSDKLRSNDAAIFYIEQKN